MNVALSALPDFACLPGEGEHHRSGIIIAPTLDYMDRAFSTPRRRAGPESRSSRWLIPSTVDD